MRDVFRASLRACLRARKPALIWGSPGTGKTRTIESSAARGSWAEGLGVVHVETLILAIREATDVGGLPIVSRSGEEAIVALAAPGWARRVVEKAEAHPDGVVIVLWDEISCATPAQQAAVLRVILDRWVGETRLPDNVWQVAIANPPDEAAGGWDLAPPLANRFWHGKWEVDRASWCQGMITGWPGEPLISTKAREARRLVASFIQARPNLILSVPKGMEERGQAWASPRTWTQAADLMASAAEDRGCQVLELQEDIILSLASGSVGEAPALEFVSWLRELDLPDPEALLADPSSYQRPARGDQEWAALAAVVAAVADQPTRERWHAAWKVLDRAAELGAPDVAASQVGPLMRLARPGGVKALQGQYPRPEVLKRFTSLVKEAGLL